MAADQSVVEDFPTDQRTQPRELVVAAQGVPVPPDCPEQLRKLLPIAPEYPWFSQVNWDLAGQCAAAIVEAWRQRSGSVKFYAGQVLDLYQQDRAACCCSLLPHAEPVRVIPKGKWVAHQRCVLRLR